MVPVKPFTITTITAHQRAAAQPGWEEGGTPNNFFLCLTVFPWYDLTYLRYLGIHRHLGNSRERVAWALRRSEVYNQIG
jgi:hypothetical protein